MDEIEAYLSSKRVAHSVVAGDLFFRRTDGRGMFVRAHADGTFDWSINAAPNDANLMDFREPERRKHVELLKRIDDFLSGEMAGRLLLDTLGMVKRSVAAGRSREQAERIAIVNRDFISGLHEAGMTAGEIRTRMGEIHNHLKSLRLEEERSGSRHDDL